VTVLSLVPALVEVEEPGSPHYLIFNYVRQITGCGCGFVAHPDDHGFGNSVVQHLLEQGN
jgi:hypothetical protein